MSAVEGWGVVLGPMVGPLRVDGAGGEPALVRHIVPDRKEPGATRAMLDQVDTRSGPSPADNGDQRPSSGSWWAGDGSDVAW